MNKITITIVNYNGVKINYRFLVDQKQKTAELLGRCNLLNEMLIITHLNKMGLQLKYGHIEMLKRRKK